MASRIAHNFKAGALALIRGDWANRVARRCSYWASGTGMQCIFPENPDGATPNLIALDVPMATKLIHQQMLETGLLSRDEEPLTLRTVKKTQNSSTVVDYAIVYLKSLTLSFGGKDYTIQSGTGAGQLQTIADSPNWYRITGMTTGDFYLNETSAGSLALKFGATATSGVFSHKVGSIAATSPWDVTQYKRPVRAEQVVTEGGSGGGDGVLHPFTVRCVTKKSGSSTVLDYWKIYLGGTTIAIGKTDYTVMTGTSTGYVSAITGEEGWYKINGITSGSLWLVDCSTEQSTGGAKNYRVKFANASVGANRASLLIAGLSFSNETGTVTQAPVGLQGYAGTSDTEHDGTNGIDICGAMSTNTSTSNFTQAGQSLVQKTWERGVTVLQHNTGTTNNPVWVNDVDAQGNTQLCGVKMRMITRVVRIVDRDFFLYRELVFDKNGMLRTVSEEKAAYGEMNDLNY